MVKLSYLGSMQKSRLYASAFLGWLKKDDLRKHYKPFILQRRMTEEGKIGGVGAELLFSFAIEDGKTPIGHLSIGPSITASSDHNVTFYLEPRVHGSELEMDAHKAVVAYLHQYMHEKGIDAVTMHYHRENTWARTQAYQLGFSPSEKEALSPEHVRMELHR